MFDSVRNNKRAVQIFLALITLPFAFWGVDSYVRNVGAGSDLASVGDSKITLHSFDQAWRAQQDRMRQLLGANYRPEAMNTPEARLAVLDALIDQRLLLLEATKNHLVTGDEMLREVIGRIPALQENGQFSLTRYQSALAAQGMSQAQFEAQLRQDLTLQQLIGAIGDTAIVGSEVGAALLRLQSEERHVAEWRISAEQFAAQVKIDPAAVQKFYDENPKRFETAEQARAEYVVLSLDSLLAQTVVSESEVSAWYQGHKERYQQAEERRASHILLTGDGDKAKAKAKAEEVLKEVQKTPERFAELARQHSQDPGSAEKGGDLGFFARGMMVKPFEEAAFALRENEISQLVESDFGYHIIRLTGVKPGKLRALNEVRGEIEDELKRQAASRQFAEAAESFSNMVYEQADSLQPVADKFKLKIEQSAWLPRNASPEAIAALGPLGNTKLLTALFADDSLKNKRNTEAVEIAPNRLLAARVVEHRPASLRPFAEVKGDIESTLRAEEAAALARKTGESRLAELRAGDDKLPWSTVRSIGRNDARQVSQEALKAIFRSDASKLPAYVGSPGSGGYTLYKLIKVSHPDTTDEQRRQAVRREYAALLGQEEFHAYLAGLRTRYKIDINKAMLESKDR